MADIKILEKNEDLRESMEMLFYAYRDFTGVANIILTDYNLGRAHHRVIYFVRQYPDMTVSDLLNILKITKQSLNRVLSKLIDDGFVVQGMDKMDKRKRLLGLTAKGIDLEAEITNAQTDFIQQAYTYANDPIATAGFKNILIAMMDKNEQDRFK